MYQQMIKPELIHVLKIRDEQLKDIFKTLKEGKEFKATVSRAMGLESNLVGDLRTMFSLPVSSRIFYFVRPIEARIRRWFKKNFAR